MLSDVSLIVQNLIFLVFFNVAVVSTKNVYAMNVLRRVKAKLEGRDFASQKVQDIQEQKTDDTNVVPQTKRMSVAEQVHYRNRMFNRFQHSLFRKNTSECFVLIIFERIFERVLIP
jgi:hypothetical protein